MHTVYVCVMCIFTKSHNISFVCCLLRMEVWGYGFMVGVGLLSGVSISLAIFAFSSFRLHQTCIHTRRSILHSRHTIYYARTLTFKYMVCFIEFTVAQCLLSRRHNPYVSFFSLLFAVYLFYFSQYVYFGAFTSSNTLTHTHTHIYTLTRMQYLPDTCSFSFSRSLTYTQLLCLNIVFDSISTTNKTSKINDTTSPRKFSC